MQKALYYFLANNLASEEDKKKLTETFKALDANGDGVLSKEEIKNGYKKTCGITNDELEALVKEVDANSNASINYSEFMVAALNRRDLLTDARIEACFRLFDRVSHASEKNLLSRIARGRFPSPSSRKCSEGKTLPSRNGPKP